MRRTLTSDAIASAFLDACLAELDALKPGNVHRHGEDTRMSVADFENSASAAAPPLARAGLSVGERIKLAVEATSAAVGHNTNLGIILLCAPLAQAALEPGEGSLQERLARVLAGLTLADARDAYAAIRQAKAGGLGVAPRHDVASEPGITLLEAMREAESRDRIAWNYAHDFADIFARGVPRFRQACVRFGDEHWAVSFTYLSFLAATPDTLIERKSGRSIAAQVIEEAKLVLTRLEAAEQPEEVTSALLAFDRSLKDRGLNPGTSADLTVATLFAAALEVLKNHQ